MTVRVVGRSNRSTRRNLANNDIVVKTSTTKRVNYLPSVPGPVARDSSFNNTSLLIHADGTTGANNTVFLDSSGTTTFIPFSGTYSNFFNGDTDYLTTSANASNQLTSDFTIEFWVYPLSLGTQRGLVNVTNTTSSGSNGLSIFFDTSNRIGFFVNGNGTTTYSSNNIVSTNVWYHVALVRSGSTNTLYLNGVSVATSSTTPTWPATPSIGVGRMYNDNTGILLAGYLSNVRIVKGTALYTSQFIPPSSQLTAIANTQLLTCQSSTFKDNSTNNFTLTQSGIPLISSGGTPVTIGGGRPIQGTFSPFNTTGWGAYISNRPQVASTITCNGDFTIEFWYYATSWGAQAWMFDTRVNNNTNVNLQWTTGGVSHGDATVIISSYTTGDIQTTLLNSWNHIVLMRSNNIVYVFLNGKQIGSGAFSTAITLGYLNWMSRWDGVYAGTGYMSNFRIVNGTAVYPIGSFTVPTSPLSIIANTSILCFNSRNYIKDATGNYTITPGTGSAVLLTSPFAPQGAYTTNTNGSSIYFNGSSDYLLSSTYPSFDLSSSTSWTIECWLYPTLTQGSYIVQNYTTALVGTIYGLAFTYSMEGSGILSFGTYNGSAAGAPQFKLDYPIANNTWTHVAAVRNGSATNNITLYINGAVANTGTYTTWPVPDNRSSYIGARKYGSLQSYFGGYISDLKSVIGKAVYTSAFTPSSTPATPSDAPVLLLNGTNAGIIDQTGRNNLTTYGSAAVSSTQSKFGGTSMYFDGSTGYVTGTNTLLAFGTGNFTAEAWVYPLALTPSASTSPNVFSIWNSTSSNAGWQLCISTTGIYVRQLSNVIINTGGAGNSVTTNTWYHIALVRSSGVMTMYLNGIAVGTTSTVYTFTDNIFSTGAGPGGAATTFFNGYIDELRISNYARYTSNFTPTIPVTALLVAGGGGGGSNIGGGGGGGGLIYNNFNISPYDTYTVTVGGGGAGGAGNNNGTNGSNTSLIGTSTYGSFSNTVIGGGGGGNYGQGSSVAGNNGGSGGGAPGAGSGQGKAAGTGIAGQGNDGGAGVASDGNGAGGGGGGSANTGGAASNRIGGEGGTGTPYAISGSSVYYAGGGGGASNTLGGVSPTANGGATAAGNTTVAAALNNSGGGGGGAAGLGVLAVSGTGGNGGSGVAIISYSGNPQFTGGTITSVGSSTVHTFTTSGTLTPLNTFSGVFTSAFPDQ